MSASTLEQAGRTLAVLLPIAAATVIVGHETVLRAGVKALVWGVVWLGCLNLSLAANRTTLAALGPRVPVLRGALLGLAGLTALGVWVPALKFGVGTALTLASVIVVTMATWETLVARRLRPPTRLLLVGPRKACVNVIRDLSHGNGGRVQLAGIVDDGSSPEGGRSLILGTTSQLGRIVETVRPDLVALVPGCDRPQTFAQLLDSAATGFRVLELSQFYEHAFGRLPVRDLTRAWFMSVLHLYQCPYSKFVKRGADLVGVALLLVVVIPVWPVLILLARSTPGPTFVRQARVGEHGRIFTMYKFRTMRVDAERPGEAIWASKEDPRVTTAGRILRRFRLDELPQIWNVVKGDMSIVGPRPERPEFIDELDEAVPFWDRRNLVKPGITGWAQINRGYTADTEGSLEKLSYDLWYIRHRSLTVDLLISVRTLAAVLRREPEVVRSVDAIDFDPATMLPGHAFSGQLEPGSTAGVGRST